MPKDQHSVASHLQCSLSTSYQHAHHFTQGKQCHVSVQKTDEQNCYLPAHKRQRLLSLDCVLEVHHLLEEKLVNVQIHTKLHYKCHIIDQSQKAFRLQY